MGDKTFNEAFGSASGDSVTFPQPGAETPASVTKDAAADFAMLQVHLRIVHMCICHRLFCSMATLVHMFRGLR